MNNLTQDKAQEIHSDLRSRRANWILQNRGSKKLNERHEQILFLASQGLRPAEIAKKLDLSSASLVSTTLGKLYERFEVPVNPTPEQEYFLYGSKPKAETVARETIIHRKRAEGVRPLDEYRQMLKERKEALHADILLLHQRGETNMEIAKKLGKSDTTIRNILQEHGLLANKNRDRISRAEAREICQKADTAVIRRRLARGWSVGQMALADETGRGIVIAQMLRLGFDVPEEELWVRVDSDGNRVPYNPDKKYGMKGVHR